MLASVPNLFYVIGIPVSSLLLVIAVCVGIYKMLGGVFPER